MLTIHDIAREFYFSLKNRLNKIGRGTVLEGQHSDGELTTNVEFEITQRDLDLTEKDFCDRILAPVAAAMANTLSLKFPVSNGLIRLKEFTMSDNPSYAVCQDFNRQQLSIRALSRETRSGLFVIIQVSPA
jgi:hypothetical protein